MSLVSFSLIYFSLAAMLTGYPLDLEESNKSHFETLDQAAMSSDIIQHKGFSGPTIAQMIRSFHQGSIATQPPQTESEQQAPADTKDEIQSVLITEPTGEASELH
jgi:hypothetical protein